MTMTIAQMFRSEKDPETIPVDWLLERFRLWRKSELVSTDFTQLPDSPADSEAFANYRQQLRDLPATKDFANARMPERP